MDHDQFLGNYLEYFIELQAPAYFSKIWEILQNKL